MTISSSVQSYLQGQAVPFEEVPHPFAMCASEAAQVAHISGTNLAKGVVLRGNDGYMLAVLPASRHVRLDTLGGWLGQPVQLAREAEIQPLFSDCEYGAVPPVGGAYGLEMIVDDSLLDNRDVYFEGGDHCTLVHVSSDGWRRMTGRARHASFSD